MQSSSVIEKAKKLGINVDGYDTDEEKLQIIADQLGVDFTGDNIGDIDAALDANIDDDSMSQTDLSDIEDLDEIPQEMESPTRFGEKEYNDARDENGVYDKDYYSKKGNELDEKVKQPEEKGRNFKKKDPKDEGPAKPDGSNVRGKNKFDRAKDNLEVMKGKNARFQNKIKADQVMHSGEALKNKAANAAKNAAQNVGKKAGQAAAKVGKAAGKAIGKAALAGGKAIISFLVSNPIVLIILVAVLFVLLIIILIFGGNPNSEDMYGYYDPECNFNETRVTLNSCSGSGSETMSLKEYTIGMTYSYIKDSDYSDVTIKTLMIILKTNALSDGNYSSSNKSVTIDDCNMEYVDASSSDSSRLEKIYSGIEEELFISTSYNDTITNLSSSSSLDIDSSIVEEIESLSSSLDYKEILNKIYNTESDVVEDDVEDEYRQTIFVGDSRMTGMKNYGIVSDTNSVYAGAMGYYWFVGSASSSYATSTYNCKSNAINCVNEKIGSNKSNIVVWLGVNDTTNYEKYYQKFYELATGEWKNNYIYVVSVGYVDDNRSQYANNSGIETFNNYMRSSINGSGLSNLIYVDLGFSSTTMAEGTTDGVHYSSDFSKQIYNKMVSSVGGSANISTKKKIYKLSDYCTYYSITENDAYWWPIGSKEPTKGNIYGGAPSVTYVSSGYGPRTINGISGFHSGIDIAGACESNVIIATKSGTVTTASDGCPSYGEYQNNCGGGYGNYVIVDHGDGTSSVYAHMFKNSVAVSVGDVVNQGEKLGLIGSSGSSTGCHLHFEIRINGSRVNPADYISADNPRPVNKYNLGDVDDSAASASENKIEICKSLLRSGFSENSVAGMMVNIQAEGGFKTNNLENCYEEDNCCKVNGNNYGFCVHPEIRGFGSDTLYTAGVDSGAYPREKFVNDRAGYGLIQWTSSGRKAGLYDYAKSSRKSIAALSVQLGWLLKELEGYPVTYKYVTGNYSAYDVANNFCLDFERPANKESNCPARARNNSQSMLQFVKNGCSD